MGYQQLARQQLSFGRMCSGVNLACVSDCLEHQEMNMETVNTSEEKEPMGFIQVSVGQVQPLYRSRTLTHY